MSLIDLIPDLKKVANTNGGEYTCPCPFCGGDDRFRVWPSRDRYWCRQCEKSGDSIQFLRDARGMSFPEAKTYLGQTIESVTLSRPARQEKMVKVIPPEWITKAKAFTKNCEQQLFGPKGTDTISFLQGRGLKADTIKRFRLGFNPGQLFLNRMDWGLLPGKKLWLPAGLIIPCMDENGVFRIRIRQPSGIPRYVFISGGDSKPWIIPGSGNGVVVVESELDATLVWQEANGSVSVLALGSAQMKPTSDQLFFLIGKNVLCCLDYDEPGMKASQYWVNMGAKFWPVPSKKDPTEFFQTGGDIGLWIAAGLSQFKTYKNH